MATGTGPPNLAAPADQSPDELGENDLRVVFKALHSVAEKYKFLSVEMNVKMNEIKKIQSQCSDPGECLLEVLSVRLKQIPSLTWRDIDTALRADTVGESQLADRISRQYGHHYSPDPSFEVSLDQEQGRKKSDRIKSKRKAKKEKSSRKYTRDSDEEVSESERYRKTSEKLQMNVNEAVAKTTKEISKKSPYTKGRSKPEKEYIERESKHGGDTQRKKKATKYDEDSEVVCGNQLRRTVKHSEQRAQKEEQIESESESSASSSEEETVNTDDFETAEESYSSEQDERSSEETEKPSKQPRGDENPHSHRKTPVKKTREKRGKSLAIEKTKFESQNKPKAKAKQEKKAEDQSVIIEVSQHEIVGDAHGKCEGVARKHKQQKKSEKHLKKGVQKGPREGIQSESSAMMREKERLNSSYRREKGRKPISLKDEYQQKQSQEKNLDYQTAAKKNIEKKGKRTGEQSSDSDKEVREKPAPKSLRPEEVQTKSKSEDESSASTSGKIHLNESPRMKKHHKVHPNSGGNEVEKEIAVQKAKVMKQKGFHSSDTDMREQSKEDKTSTKVNQNTKKASKEKHHRADDTSPWKEREELVSEDEESDSDDSREDKEGTDSEQKSSNEEEETEPDDESSPATSEEEVKRKAYIKARVKETRGKKEKKVKTAACVKGDEDQSDPDCRDQEEHDNQPKKRSRIRHRESSMSPTARSSSSPSISQDENRRSKEIAKPKGKGKKKKEYVKKTETKEGLSSSTETDNSSPECDMLRNISEAERKGLRKVFKRFFGRLCFAIRNPVELATLLQIKGLLTYSVMNELLTSPESTQAKSITLVRALQKQTKSRPDRMFNIIDVFLHDEALQQTGREMWAETGSFKWCDGRDNY